MPYPSHQQRPTIAVATRSQGCSRVNSCFGHRCTHPRLERGVSPGPEVNTAVSAASTQDGGTTVATTRNTCSVVCLDPPRPRSHWTFASHCGNPQRGNPAFRWRYRLPSPAVGLYSPAEESTRSAQPACFAPRPACNTSCGERMAEGARMSGAVGPSLHLLVGPRRGAGLHAHWAVGHASLGKSGKEGGGTLSHWALSAVNQSDIRRRPRSQFVDWRNVLAAEGGFPSEVGGGGGEGSGGSGALGRPAAARPGLGLRTCCGGSGGRRTQQRVSDTVLSLTGGAQRRGAEG